jgi:hypothetical protein
VSYYKYQDESEFSKMDLTALERAVSNLERSLDSLTVWLFISTLLVVVGLVVEYGHDVKELFTSRPSSRKLAQTVVGGILITGGVTGELIAQFKASRVETELRANSHQIEALLNKEAGDARANAGNAVERASNAEGNLAKANERAANALKSAEIARKDAEAFRLDIAKANERAANAEREAARLNKIAEDERLARLKIEEKMAPRHLTTEQQRTIASKLRRFAGQGVNLYVHSGDTEIEGIARDIVMALGTPNGAHWVVSSVLERPDRTIPGILVELRGADAAARDAAVALVSTLNDERIFAAGPQPTESIERHTVVRGDGSNMNAPIVITIGKKP